jgi:nucleotide-binding universal stress UspA family protein
MSIMRILVAVDGSPSSDVTLDEIGRRVWPSEVEFKVVTVARPLTTVGTEMWAVPPESRDAVARAVRETGERVLEAARAKLDGAGLRVSAELLWGLPAHAVVEEAERWGANLVVVGSHGYGAVKRFLLGSVSHAIALHAPCSVEVVRAVGE